MTITMSYPRLLSVRCLKIHNLTVLVPGGVVQRNCRRLRIHHLKGSLSGGCYTTNVLRSSTVDTNMFPKIAEMGTPEGIIQGVGGRIPGAFFHVALHTIGPPGDG